MFDGYLARPDQGSAPTIMILSEMFGLNEPMRELADSYAQRGFPTVVPNVYWRSEHPRALGYDGDDRQLAWERLDRFDFTQVGGDMRQVADWARRQPWSNGKVIALGFCAGGVMAFLGAARSGLDAAISLYGLGIARYLDETAAISCPVQLHYGLKDQHISIAEIDAVSASAAGNAEHVHVHRYADAGHSFFNSIRPGFHAPSAQLAGQRIDSLLDSFK
jgi:carboxymethylenebutenolidase